MLYALTDGEKHSQKQICDDWLIPRTTLNTIVKECVANGYVTLSSTGHKEKTIVLTEAGKEYADIVLSEMVNAEMVAMKNTIEVFSDDFVDAFELFAKNLENAFASLLEKESNS